MRRILMAVLWCTTSSLAWAQIDEARRLPSTVVAEVVALTQPVLYNRFGSHNPHAMIYALRRDVVSSNDSDASLQPGRVRLRDGKRPRPLVLRANVGDILEIRFRNLLPAETGAETCRGAISNEGGGDWPVTVCAGVSVVGLPMPPAEAPSAVQVENCAPDAPAADTPDAQDGNNLGRQGLSPQRPGECRVYRFVASRPGAHLLLSHSAPAGGEGDGGSLTHGLFGVVVIEREGSRWYRSQVDASTLQAASQAAVPGAFLNYEATASDGTPLISMTRRLAEDRLEIVHSDLNAIIHCPLEERRPHAPPSAQYASVHCAAHAMREALGADGLASPEWWRANPAHRAFTVVFHDELKTRYAPPFQVLDDEQRKAIQAANGQREGVLLEGVGDGFAINYGASGMGTILLANRLGTGPARDCTECFYEEFFLSSWANGDPALLTPEMGPQLPPQVAPGAQFYPDDPGNTHHSYLGDRVVFHNLHAGPKETHVFHLHAHQWRAGSDGQGAYRDSQTIAPLQAITYEIDHGGGGNLNLTVGDSIFHCHLYPHFAQGMWGLWRNHDVLEDGTRTLPDGVLGPGTDPRSGAQRPGAPIPAVVPLPGQAMPPGPLYTADSEAALPGYPFFMAATPGHRAPQAPLDVVEDGGLGRHRVVGVGERSQPGVAGPPDPSRAIADGDFRLSLDAVNLELLPADGDPSERRAMAFHAGTGEVRDPMAGTAVPVSATAPLPGIGVVRFFDLPLPDGGSGLTAQERKGLGLREGGARLLGRFRVNGRPAQPGAPFADPCRTDEPAGPRLRTYRVSAVQLDLMVNEAGWHDPQAHINVLTEEAERLERVQGPQRAAPFFFRAHSGDCVSYLHQNRTHGELQLDDFQVATPTDTIGQHIHLVKFDVMASDGSANGWNYEDGTFAAPDLRKRVQAANVRGGAIDRRETGGGARQVLPVPADGHYQTTVQRWYADRTWQPDPLSPAPPGVACDQDGRQRWRAPGGDVQEAECKDATLRTVFTHDHFGPSSIQQHGFYSALLIEPEESVWFTADGRPMCSEAAQMPDGRPQSGCTMPVTQLLPPSGADTDLWRPNAQAVIVRAGGNAPTRRGHPDFREFPMAVADFALLYTPPNANHSPPDAEWMRTQRERLSDRAFDTLTAWRQRHGRPVDPPEAPEAISQKHHNPFLVNYAHDAVPLRIGRHSGMSDRPTLAGIEPQIGRGGAPLPVRQDCAWTRHDARDEPGLQRPGRAGDLAYAFDSLCHGDPFAEVLEAYEGEEMQIRLIQGAQEVQHVFNLPGLRWRRDPDVAHEASTGARVARAAAQLAERPAVRRDLLQSGFVSSQEVGISEHFEFRTRGVDATGPLGASDLIWHFGSSDAIWNGAWGLLRLHNGTIRDNETEWAGERRDYAAGSSATPDATCLMRATHAAARGLPQPACYRSDAEPPAIRERLLSVRAARAAVVPLAGDVLLAGVDPPAATEALVRQRAGRQPSQSPRVAFLGWNGDPGAERRPSFRNGAAANACPSHLAWFDPAAGRWAWHPVKLRSYVVVAEQAPSRPVWTGPQGTVSEPSPLRFRATHVWHSDRALPGPDGQPHLTPPADAAYEPLATSHADDGPLVLRALAGECIHVRLQHLIPPGALSPIAGEARLPGIVSLNATAEDQLPLAPSRFVSLLPQVLQQTPAQAGIHAGLNRLPGQGGEPYSQVAPAPSGTPEVEYAWFAGRFIEAPAGVPRAGPAPTAGPPELSAGFVVVGFAEDYGPVNLASGTDPFFQTAHGLVGTLVVHEADAGIPDGDSSSPRVDISLDRDGLDLGYADQVLAFRDGLNHRFRGRSLPDCPVCDDSYDRGERAAAWRAEPFWARLGLAPPSARPDGQPDPEGKPNLNEHVFPPGFFAEPAANTPRIVTSKDRPLRLNVVQPAGRARQRVFTVLGHDYRDGRYGTAPAPVAEASRSLLRAPPQDTSSCRATQDDNLATIGWYGSPGSSLLGPGRAVTAVLPCPRPGTWLWRDGPAPMFSSGVWGWLEVR